METMQTRRSDTVLATIRMNALLLGLAAALAAGVAHAASHKDAEAVPHLDDRGKAGYREFLQAAPHRAFVIAPGGTWTWRAEMPNTDMALDAALQDCRRATQQRCFPYAVDQQVVFDARSWPLAWGPYLKKAEAARAPEGVQRGQRFYDLVLRGQDGKATKLSDFRGKVVFLHFWGSWCPPCQREMPDLQKLYGLFKSSRDVSFVFLPVRESMDETRDWMRQKRISVPVYDVGAANQEDGSLTQANGKTLKDRELAKAFPTTYVLDKHGVVVFSHMGPVSGWSEYVPFLKDVATKSGR